MSVGGKRKGAGRKAGVPNKATQEFKAHLNDLMEKAAPDMVAWLNEVDDPVKRFDILSKFAEYIYPKLQRTEHAGDKDNPISHNVDVTFK